MPAVFVLIWSTGFIVAKFGLPFAPPLTFLAMRYALSIFCFLIWIRFSRARWPQGRQQWLHLAVTGVLMHAGYLGGVWVAVKGGMGSGLAALVVGLQPVLTALWVSWAGLSGDSATEHKVSPRQWMGLVLGLGGLLLVVARKFGTGSEVTLLTLGCTVFALLSITVGTLYQKKHGGAADLRTGSLIQFAASFVVVLPVALVLESTPVDYTAEFWGALAWSVLALSIVAITLLLVMIRRGRATEVASLMYLTPPTTALFAWLLFGEQLGALAWTGVVVTMAGVALVLKSGKKNA